MLTITLTTTNFRSLFVRERERERDSKPDISIFLQQVHKLRLLVLVFRTFGLWFYFEKIKLSVSFTSERLLSLGFGFCISK